MLRTLSRRFFGLGAAGLLAAFPGAGHARPAPTPEPEHKPLRIVVVHWKIRPGQEAAFLEYWPTRATIKDRSGLVGEFLSSVEDRSVFPWITLQSLDPRWTSFFNVGLWRSAEAFQAQVGRYIDDERPLLEFEAARRERVFLAAERWRVGASTLPARDPAGVL